MFNIGMPEVILILVVALIILGPKKLPEVAKSLGKGLREFRKAADDIKEGLEKDLRPEARKADSDPALIKQGSKDSPRTADTPADKQETDPATASGETAQGHRD
jgi:sec-independent protein translocase protein TatA